MINDLKDKVLTKEQVIRKIKDKLKKEKDLHLRNILSKDSFEMPDWSKYLAYQLGYMAALEELDNFIPDPENITQ